MREIKFRAWYKGKMYKFDLPSYMIHIEESQEKMCPMNATDNLQQYTGLHDKNDKDIYEGDIVRFKDLRDATEPEFTGCVEFATGEFTIRTGYASFDNWLSLRVEVVGNIYENPELLEETSND